MKKNCGDHESATSLLFLENQPDTGTKQVLFTRSQPRKFSSVLLSRLAKEAYGRRNNSKIVGTALTRKQSPVAIHNSGLVTRKHTLPPQLSVELQFPKKEHNTVKVSSKARIIQSHRRALSGEIIREREPMYAEQSSKASKLMSESSNGNLSPSNIAENPNKVMEEMQDLLYNFSSKLAIIYESSPKPRPPALTALRKHREFICTLRSVRFGSDLLKRAVFQAWKTGYRHSP